MTQAILCVIFMALVIALTVTDKISSTTKIIIASLVALLFNLILLF